MDAPTDTDGPFPFEQADLASDKLNIGARRTLAHFYRWRDSHPGDVADHIDQCTRVLRTASTAYRWPSIIGRRLSRTRRSAAEQHRIAQEASYFAVYNLAELPDPATITRIVDDGRHRIPTVRRIQADIDPRRGLAGVRDSLIRHIPVLTTVDTFDWLISRMDRLHRSLPQRVIEAGAMGKVIRTIAGVLAIATWDTVDADRAARRAHLTRVVPAAYAYGTAYAVVDDSFQDTSGAHLSQQDRARCHRAMVRALSTGRAVDVGELPDHPLVDELDELFRMLLAAYPFDEYRHLYHAAESMYLAQHRDSILSADRVASAGLAEMYPDIFIKAGMSRIVANILGRRRLSADFYRRCLNSKFLNQLSDDLRDREEDHASGRLTPFTVPVRSGDGNPLYDLFAYRAYVAGQVFDGHATAAEALIQFEVSKLARYFATDRRRAEALMGRYELTGELTAFLRCAAGLPPGVTWRMLSADRALKERGEQVFGHREPTSVDCRTFVADRLDYINEVIRRSYEQPDDAEPDELRRIVGYAMDSPGKRLRPALLLMLAEAYGVDYDSIRPLIAAGELLHTASLLFDDLPAQDDAAYRRGRPAAHRVFDEGSVQLAALSMVSRGFGVLADLTADFPAERVTEVIAYVGNHLGPDRLCRGQYLDLHFSRAEAVSVDGVLEMYSLKTSAAIECAMVPLLMLLDRPAGDIDAVRRYAYHSGIVFQIRDDMLDRTSSRAQLGKDADHDAEKVNLVREFGLPEAERLMRRHLDEAIDCCAGLPFDAGLLADMVRYFASRRK